MIRSISIDKFGDIDSLQLQLNKYHKMDVSSGGASLLTMLLALSQSFLPGYAYDWQSVTRPGESSFGTGRFAVRGRLFDGGAFAKCLHEDSSYCSCGTWFVIENPENPVANGSNTGGAVSNGSNAADAARSKQTRPPYADKKRAGADDFRELCRLYGEKFANVKRFVLGIDASFAKKGDDNILSYQMVSIKCERVWDEDITSFFELVLYKNGTNYDLYWDELPDIRGTRTSGRAKGCNVRMRNLAVLDIVSDGVQDGVSFEEVLPSIIRVSRIAADQFGTVRFLEVGQQVTAQEAGCCVESKESAQGYCYSVESKESAQRHCYSVESKESAQESCYSVGPQKSVKGPCYYVGAHGEYTEAVVRTYTEEKIRVAWPDPATGEIRHGLFTEAYETWKNEIGNPLRDVSGSGIEGLFRDKSENKTGSPHPDRIGAEDSALVQGLILRTGETLVLCGDARLPDKFFEYLSNMGRQIVRIRSFPED